MDKKGIKYGTLCGLILFPILHFYLMEGYTHNGFEEIRYWSQIFNILLFEILAWILTFLSGNVKWALRAEGICAMVIGLANYYVYSFRSLPLVPWDVFSIGTAAGVAGNYDFTPEPRVIVVILAFAGVLYLEKFCTLDFGRMKWYFRLPVALVFVLVLTLFAGMLQREDFQNRHQMYNKLFTPVYMWQVNGFALTMVMELPYMAIEKPEGYAKEEAQKTLEAYAPKDENKKGAMPNIIVVMNEAFSDLGVLGEFQASEDYMPFFHSMMNGKANTISGYLHVSVCGGNTANTEFEFLTGNTMAFLPQGSIPFQQYIHSSIPALPGYFNELGYETHAMHPYYSSGWDRDEVYPLLGFSHSEFIEDFTNREYIRNYVSDKSCNEKIIRTFENKASDRPVFIFNVTMQNHGSYLDVYENFLPHISVEGASSPSLSAYLSLISKSDKALEEMISYFSDEEEPVLVVFFGDHQPNDTVAEPIMRLNGKSCRSLSEKDTYLRYQVPYLIWANYDIEEETHADTSANFLAVKMLRAAGLPMTAYHHFLEELSESYPVVSAARTEKASKIMVDLEEYKKLQYYQLFDMQENR